MNCKQRVGICWTKPIHSVVKQLRLPMEFCKLKLKSFLPGRIFRLLCMTVVVSVGQRLMIHLTS